MYQTTASDDIYCVILSGGKSSRMNTHKALLPFNEHHNFLQHIVNVYLQAGIRSVILVKNIKMDLSSIQEQKKMFTAVANPFPDKGRLYSVQLGLAAMPGNGYCFIQNIDNPFVSEHLIKALIETKTQAYCITPEYKGTGGHPVLISPAIVNYLLNITEYNQTLKEVLNGFSRHKVKTDDGNCLININTPENYQYYFPGNIKTIAAV